MHSGKITYLLDIYQGHRYYFEESWDLYSPSDEEAMSRLNCVAKARLGLLAGNIQIAKLTMTGNDLQRPMWRGAAGGFAMPWDKLQVRRDGYATRRAICGVPRGGFGQTALNHLNQVLRECGIIAERNGKPEPIGTLQVTYANTKFMRNCKKATKAMLVDILGHEAAADAWAELLAARKQETQNVKGSGAV